MSNSCSKKDHFCYICAKFVFETTKCNFSSKLEDAYKQYFGIDIIQNVWYIPKYCCGTCYRKLLFWMNGERKSMGFGVPAIWIDPVSHYEAVCYFCLNYEKSFGHNKNTINSIEYMQVPSVQLPKPHSEVIPVPEPPQLHTEFENEIFIETPGTSRSNTVSYVPSNDSGNMNRPMLIDQSYLNNLVRDLNLSKQQGELLGSRLKERNLLEPGTRYENYPAKKENKTKNKLQKVKKVQRKYTPRHKNKN